MEINIYELNEDLLSKYDIEKFLLDMVKLCYDMDYTPEYHQDIKNLEEYYLKPEKNTFVLALDSKKDKIIGTCAIRAYDRDFKIKDRNYNDKETASIYRLFVEPTYRHNKIATKMLKKIEEFCENNYKEIYLHTQKDSYGGLPFWLSQEYIIVEESNDEFGTIHLEKIL